MIIRRNKSIILIIVIFILLLFISRASSKPDGKNLTFTIKKDSTLEKALIVGDPTKPIVNPKSVSLTRLLENNELYQEALEAEAENLEARYDIAMETANASVRKQVELYAQKNNIQTVFQESVFFEFLRLIPDFKNKTDQELRSSFDITDNVLRAQEKQQDKIKEIEKDFPDKKEKPLLKNNK